MHRKREREDWVVGVMEHPHNEADHEKISMVTGIGWMGTLKCWRLRWQLALE